MNQSTSHLRDIPLTESILQRCYKSKTYVRNGEWYILWHLGGKNNVTIGEKKVTKPVNSLSDELTEYSEFYYIPDIPTKKETVTVLLPKGIEHCQNQTYSAQLIQLSTVADLEKVFPEFRNIISKSKLRF